MEASAFRCPSCGASVEAQAIQCHYCRSHLATVACPNCFGLVSLQAKFCSHCGSEVTVCEQAGTSALQCPECRIKLVVTPVGGVDLHQCQTCGGLWLAKERFESLAAAREKRSLDLPITPERPPLALQPVRYRPCPMCATMMNRLHYAKHSGVILDLCRQHGLWFDKDELRQCLAFIDNGGLARAREREKLALEDARRAATPMGGQGMLPSEGEDSLGLDVDSLFGRALGGLLEGAMRTLWRTFKG